MRFGIAVRIWHLALALPLSAAVTMFAGADAQVPPAKSGKSMPAANTAATYDMVGGIVKSSRLLSPGQAPAKTMASPPQAGIELIERIIQRVRETPQIALLQEGLRQRRALNQLDGPTDYRLAIKPREKSDGAMPQIAMEPTSAAGAEGAPGFAANQLQAKRQRGFWERDEESVTASADYGGDDGDRGIWEKELNKLAPAGKEEARQDALKGKQKSLFHMQPATSSSKLQLEDEAPTLKAALSQAGGGVARSQVQGTLLRNLNKAGNDKANLGASRVSQKSLARSPAALSMEVATLPPTHMGKFVQTPGDNQFSQGQQALEEKSQIVREYQTAMLHPPLVVQGIPMVKLESSELEASKALIQLGNVQRQKIDEWTVLSLKRANSPEPLIQVFINRGLVTALRVFDSALLGASMGVKVGSTLADVKRAFGEPTFIMKEPLSGKGQNYIYPFSRIGFQLCRFSPNAEPEVVSMLIFSTAYRPQ